jgi:hypothetical protein
MNIAAKTVRICLRTSLSPLSFKVMLQPGHLSSAGIGRARYKPERIFCVNMRE